jgi:hypothetical protein
LLVGALDDTDPRSGEKPDGAGLDLVEFALDLAEICGE